MLPLSAGGRIRAALHGPYGSQGSGFGRYRHQPEGDPEHGHARTFPAAFPEPARIGYVPLAAEGGSG